jgi:4-hydroxybenzoate polyprenyltransferase
MTFKKLSHYVRLARLHKPVGIFLLLWPTLIALWIAGQGRPNPFLVGVFVLGVIVMRSAGCVINDLIDKDFDVYVERTKIRPLATGALTSKEAILFFYFLSFIAFLLALTLNKLSLKIACIAMVLTVIYPFMKRYTYLPQLVLGAAFGTAIPLAFSALTNTVPLEAFILYGTVLIWAVIYDTEYAMADRIDDEKIGLKSTAILFAQYDRFIISLLQIIFLMLLSFLGFLLAFDKFYFLGLIFIILFFVYQQWLIKARKPVQCFKAFLNNQWLGFFWFLMILLQYRTF